MHTGGLFPGRRMEPVIGVWRVKGSPYVQKSVKLSLYKPESVIIFQPKLSKRQQQKR
jgi:hypothetical protein